VEGDRTVTVNRHAWHDYDITETYECGIVLTGPEVKSARNGRVSLKESYARIIGNEAFIIGMHIAPYAQANRQNLDPTRPRKLLLKRAEIKRLIGKTQERGFTLVPLKFYFRKGLAKVELGLGRGRAKHDKRRIIAERDARRDIERELKERNR
jgi:SsrA-binding protein